jgi:hypothetical protein
MTPEPMPHPNEDAAHLAARASKAAYMADADAIRANVNYSDRYKMQHVAERYDQHVSEVSKAYESLTERRRARLSYLESLVPLGPGVPEATSPADKAVLITAFRTALATVKDTNLEGRAQLLDEAEKFDDDAMRRAVLTHAMEHGEHSTVRAWTDRHTDAAGLLDETIKLHALIAGQHFETAWDVQDFTPVPKPMEAYDWLRIKGLPEGMQVPDGRTVRPGVVEYGH